MTLVSELRLICLLEKTSSQKVLCVSELQAVERPEEGGGGCFRRRNLPCEFKSWIEYFEKMIDARATQAPSEVNQEILEGFCLYALELVPCVQFW